MWTSVSWTRITVARSTIRCGIHAGRPATRPRAVRDGASTAGLYPPRASQGRETKLYTTMMALNFRRANRALFQNGAYIPLESNGAEEDRVRAFARLQREQATVTVVPRLVASFTGGPNTLPVGPDTWGAPGLVPSWRAGSPYRNLSRREVVVSESGESQRLSVAEVSEEYPVALLERLT